MSTHDQNADVQIIGSKARKKLVSELQLQQRHYIMDATVKELDRKLGDDTGKVFMAWIAWEMIAWMA